LLPKLDAEWPAVQAGSSPHQGRDVHRGSAGKRIQ
jgi:hypothetical protein